MANCKKCENELWEGMHTCREKPFMRWALPQLPTGSDVARLVEQKVITPEEARQICFREPKECDHPKDRRAVRQDLEERVEYERCCLCDEVVQRRLFDMNGSTNPANWIYKELN